METIFQRPLHKMKKKLSNTLQMYSNSITERRELDYFDQAIPRHTNSGRRSEEGSGV